MNSVWLNYRPLEKTDCCVSVFDRGVQYGDGFFTTAKVVNGVLLNWTAHKARLQMSCQRLGFPEMDVEKLEHSLQQQFADYAQTDAVCKILVTRGEGGRGYLPPETPNIQVFSLLMPLPAFAEQAIHAQLSSVILEVSPMLAGVKHLNRLTNVLARQTMNAGFAEALMLNAFGQVQCATQSNLFVIKDHQVFTPPVTLSGVAGTARQSLIESKLVIEKSLQIQDILEADGLFFSNAVRGIQVVEMLDLANYSILQSEFQRLNLELLASLPAGETLTFKTNLPILQDLQQAFLQTQTENGLDLLA